eukprot:CAMPEP_0196807774 /NCGR_PEP_ID=MMETSP1362-20130617/7765_1 /TAXON_ID=163516 /ORGANISM="Leptocylindrus danicus, Strain CCMP1856" /LENGTH=346 /DNA_ID=CAMNT_0042181837 /DNA_START=59 /DNA_END=1100 /DNA_ORIENTATION=+
MTLKRMESSYGYYAPRRSSGQSGCVLRTAGSEYLVASLTCDTDDKPHLSAAISKNQLPHEHGSICSTIGESATVTTANTCSTTCLDYMMCDDSTVGIVAVSDSETDEEDDASQREWARSRQRSLVLNIVDLPSLEDVFTFPSDSMLNTVESDREEAEQRDTLLLTSSAANDIINKGCNDAMDMVDEFLKTGTWSNGSADLSQQPQEQDSERKKVHFSNVTIREYALCIGEVSDHYPIEGPPLSLDWAHTNERTISVKEHERRFYKRSSLRRLDSLHRKFLLTVVGGFTEEDFRMQREKSKKSNKFRKLKCFFRKKIAIFQKDERILYNMVVMSERDDLGLLFDASA